MTGFGDAMRAAGFGPDPAGDRERREELRDLHAGRDSPGALAREHAPVPGHLLTYRKGRAGTEVTCECGRWDGWFNGPRSRRVVLGDHAHHVTAETSAPIKVRSERADSPEELE